MSSPLLEVKKGEGEGCVVLREAAAAVLAGLKGGVDVFLQVQAQAQAQVQTEVKAVGSASGSQGAEGGGGGAGGESCVVPYEVQKGANGRSFCMIDITPLVSGGESVAGKEGGGQGGLSTPFTTVCNLLSLSSGLFVQLDVDDNNKTIEKLSFFNELLEHFDNHISALQSSVCIPVIHHYTVGDGLSTKASKRAVEKLLQPENGFSEEIGKRNCTRKVLSSLSCHKDLVQLHKHSGTLVTHAGVIDSMSQTQPKHVQCLQLSGPLISDYLHTLQKLSRSSKILDSDDLDLLVEPVLNREEANAFAFFTQSQTEISCTLPPAVVLKRRFDALSRHQAIIATPTARSQASRKNLQSRMRATITAYKTSRLNRFRKRCESILLDLTTTHFKEDHKDLSVLSKLKLELGESSNVYSQFLAFKNSLEKIVNTYQATDIVALLAEEETKVERGEFESELDEALVFYLDVEGAEASILKHDVLYEFIMKQANSILTMGSAWVESFKALAAASTAKMNDLEVNAKAVESELESLSRTAISEKEEAGVVIVGLMDTFEIAREEQSRILDEKELELERLVAGLDRTTKLNETDKEDLTNELLKVQEKIQDAQKKSMELRQERENQTSTLQNDLLEEERKGHRWFRSTIARQHALLSEELSLERKVNQTKSQQMEQMFSLESEHMRNLEKIRTAAQDQRQSFRDDLFRQREKCAQEHDTTMAALRERNMELDMKLSTANFNSSETNNEDEKSCVVM